MTENSPTPPWEREFADLVRDVEANLADGGTGPDPSVPADGVRADSAAIARARWAAELVSSATVAPDVSFERRDAVRASVLALVAGESAGSAAHAVVGDDVRAGPAAELVPAERSWRQRRPLAAIAAAVVAAAAALFALAPGPGTSVAFATPLVAAPGSPSPNATGEAQLLKTKHGWVMRLRASGLAANPSGALYQCWYVAEADGPDHQDRISIGTFRTKDGTVDVEWPTAADPRRYPKVGITLEPDDGDPLKTGPKVLTSAKPAKLP